MAVRRLSAYSAVISWLLYLPLVWAAAPSRSFTYTSGSTISSSQVTTNEDNIYTYLQAGVDTYAADSITAAAVAAGAVGASEIASGAVDVGDMTTAGTAADDKTIVADSATAGTWRTVPNCTDASGNHLNYTQSTNSFSCGTSSSSGTATVSDRVNRTAGDVTSASATLADMTGMSITLTTGANPALVGFYGVCRLDDATGKAIMNVDVDGAVILSTTGLRFQQSTVSEDMNCSFTVMTADLTAASHTFKIQVARETAGTATWVCNGTDSPCGMFVVEVQD